VAFVGDRSPAQGCIPVSLKPEKPWDWQGVSINCDEADFAAFHEDEADRNRWYQPDVLKTSQQLPTVLFVPTLLAKFLVDQQRTPWELFSEVKRLSSSPDYPIGDDEAELVRLWALGAAHTSDRNKSMLSMELKPVLTFVPTFTEWTQARLTGTLGALTSANPPTQLQPLAGSTEQRALNSMSLQTAETLKAVADALQKGPTASSGGPGSAATSSTKHIYIAYEIAALQGYCGVTQAQDIPRIWLTFQTA